MKALDRLKVREGLVYTVDNDLVFGDDARIGDEFASGRSGDSLPVRPLLKYDEIRRDQSRSEFMTVANERGLSNEEVGLELVFDRLRGYKLAAGGLKQFLLPVGDVEKTVGVKVSDISSTKEPLLVEVLRRAQGLLPVARENVGAGDE